MSQRTYASIMCGLIFLWVITPALAGDWTIVEGGTYPISAQIGGGADLQPGDSIIINGATNDDPVTIQIDSATVPALGDAIGAAISITAAVDVTIEFQGTNRLPLGDAANTSLEISGSGGSLLVTNAGGATGYFDFSANSNKILTIDGPVTGADAVNKFVMGNNTLRTQTAAVDLNQVTLGGANAKIDTAIATTIKTLAIAAAGNDLNIAIAEDLTLTITDAFTIPAASVVTLTATNGGVAEKLAVNNGIQLDGADAELYIVGDTGNSTLINGAVTINTNGGIITADQSATMTSCDLAGNATIDVAADKTLTVTNGVDTNTKTLNLTGPGTINRIDIDGVGGILNVMESCTVTAVYVEADGAINVVETKTLTGTVNIKNKTLTLSHKGRITTGVFAADGGILNVNETCEVTTINMNANGSVNVAAGKTLTTDLNAGNRTLKLLGNGTVTKITATTGKIQAEGSPRITTLQPSPGNGGTFTFEGAGSATVTTLTPLDTTGEIFTKTGTGSLVVTNGFSFAGATGIKLNINQGTFEDAGGQNIVFGDDAEKITVLGGATYTTSSDITGHAGASTNFESAPTSTVNFNKNGLLMLTATADNDFVLLGTVNIMDDCIVQMAGFYQSRFGHINIKNQGSLVNNIANSTLLFAPNSIITLEGFGSGTLNINGQTAATAITMSTIGDIGQFTINRGASNNMTVRYAALSNCVYLSNQGGYADAELGNKLVGLVDDGNNVNWWSPLIADAGPDKTIISGNSTMLEGSAVGAKPPYTYAWTPATGLNDPTLATPTASPTVTTEYTLTVTDSVGTSDVDVMTVTVTPALAVDAGPDQEIGRGESVMLQGAATGGSGQYAYAWSPTTGLDNPTSATPTCSPEQTTTYTLTVADLGDQNKTASDTVTILVGGLSACGTGICGAGGVGLLPLTLLGLTGCKWSWRRKNRMSS